MFCDHVALPDNDYTHHMTPTWYDPIATLGFVAGHTSTVRLITIVYIAAYRHPLVGAKSFMTLDHLSGGRVIVGVGAGHVKGEFEALDIDFESRGERTNECIDVFRAAFASTYSSFSGKHFNYDEMGLAPRPDQEHIPIWIGGSTKPALRRVAERGDGWIPQGTPRAQMRACLDYLLSYKDKVRPDAELDLGMMSEAIYVGTPTWDVGEGRLTGSPDRIAESLREAYAIGCNVLAPQLPVTGSRRVLRSAGRIRPRRRTAARPLMRAVRIASGAPVVVDVDEPAGDGVMLEVVSSSICGTDVGLLGMGMEGFTLGHEVAGSVDGVPYAVEPTIWCGTCPECRAGHTQRCVGEHRNLGIFSRRRSLRPDPGSHRVPGRPSRRPRCGRRLPGRTGLGGLARGATGRHPSRGAGGGGRRRLDRPPGRGRRLLPRPRSGDRGSPWPSTGGRGGIRRRWAVR